MKRRLRKKRRMGEFAEYGFSLRFTISQRITVSDRESLLDEFIDNIEREGLQFGGGGDHEWEGFVSLDGRGTVTEEHRAEILDWLRSHPNVESPMAGDLVDAWHGWR